MQELTLRPLLDADFDILFAQGQDAEAIHMAAFTAEDPSDRAAYDAHWARIRQLDTVTIRTIVVDEAVVGSVLKYEMDGRPEVSYWFGREFWGQGIATRALALFLEEVTDRPMYARVAADNVGSIRVLEKCGFERIAKERGYANARGEEIDEYVYALTMG
jgi:RimJ/RimL family protein N-acetyltransferase